MIVSERETRQRIKRRLEHVVEIGCAGSAEVTEPVEAGMYGSSLEQGTPAERRLC